MTVVTHEGVQRDGDLNCGLSLKNLRKLISFGKISPLTLKYRSNNGGRGPVGQEYKTVEILYLPRLHFLWYE